MSETAQSTRDSARRLGGTAVLIAALVASAMCTRGEITVVEPAAKGHGLLILSVEPDPAEAAVAQQLGWTAGIPGAEVTIAPAAGDTAIGPPIDTLVTDSAGHVSVADLPDGRYLIVVQRLLTAAEAGRLAAGEDVVGFMAREVVDRGSLTVYVPASHRRSIVISEWSFLTGVHAYWYGGFLELANNADTTVYLDGVVIGEGFTYPAPHCSSNLNNDRDGIWAFVMDTLPGTGHTYPLAPGAVAVFATDAIDHAPMHVLDGLDLSHANFESVGTCDADNPGVPNSVTIGPHWWFDCHGMEILEDPGVVTFVALPVDTTALPRQDIGQLEWWRVPRANVLDVMTAWSPGYLWNIISYCLPLVNSEFDRHPAPYILSHVNGEDSHLYSIQRKVAFVRGDGRKILQDTRSTYADFFLGYRTPFQLP